MRLARRPSPVPPRQKRPDRLRLGLRLAAGVAPARAAEAERVDEAEVLALLRQPDFAGLVEDCRRLRDLPEDERLARLEAAAWDVLELAVADGDMRAVLFVLAERRRGANPARTLARRVVAAERRSAAEPAPAPPAAAAAPPPPAPPRRGRRPDPVARSVARGASALRGAVIAEHALRAAEAPAAAVPPRHPAFARAADRSGCSTALRLVLPAARGGTSPSREALVAYLAQAP